MSDYRVRIERLQQTMQATGAAGAILAGTDQMLYLSGWREGGHERFVGLLIPALGEPEFLVPMMNAPQARRTPAGIERVTGWEDSTGWRAAAQAILAPWPGEGPILIDDEMLSVHLLGLQALFPDRQFTAAGEAMTTLREIKTPQEIEAMERAGALIDSVFEEVVTGLKAGISELDVSDSVLAAIKARGSRPSFPPLICFGENTALPHHHTGDRKLREGDMVIIDIGCTFDGYASDITRTVSFGEPSDEAAKQVYHIVSEAHWAARNAARPALPAEQVDAAARAVITDAGYGPNFVHRTGHGIGLSVHEPPNMVQGNTAPLRPGMCFSVEPGIYLDGRFGVRIENIVTVTEEGVRSVNAEADQTLRTVPTD